MTDDTRRQEIRREVRDKLSVFALANMDPLPPQRAIVCQQCEDFLVDMIAQLTAERDQLQDALATLRAQVEQSR